MFSNINIKKISLWLFITMIISFLAAGSILTTYGIENTLFNYSGKNTQQNVSIEKTFDPAAVKTIDIDSVSTDVRIIPYDSNEIKVQFYGTASQNNQDPELISEMVGDTLTVKIKHKIAINIGFQNIRLRLDVYVPKSYAENIKVKTISGSVSLDSMSLNKLSVVTTAGDLRASSINAKLIEFGTMSGNMIAEGLTGDLDYTSVSGRLDAEYASFNNNIKAHTTSGNITIKLPPDAQFNLGFKSLSGNLRSSFPVSSVDTAGRRSIIIGNSTNQIEIDSISGNAYINK